MRDDTNNDTFTKASVDAALSRGYVLSFIHEDALLTGLAEEASELSQSACKVLRAAGYVYNPTPTEYDDAIKALKEEAIDVGIYLMALGILPTKDEIEDSPKWRRWDERIEAETEGYPL